MITIISAGIKYGYSGEDHYITGSECNSVIGREYRSVRDALAAASRAASDEGEGAVRTSPVEIEVRFAHGEQRWFS